jgi:hypothetical protein
MKAGQGEGVAFLCGYHSSVLEKKFLIQVL